MVGKRRKLKLKGNIIRYAYNRDIDQLRPLTCASSRQSNPLPYFNNKEVKSILTKLCSALTSRQFPFGSILVAKRKNKDDHKNRRMF